MKTKFSAIERGEVRCGTLGVNEQMPASATARVKRLTRKPDFISSAVGLLIEIAYADPIVRESGRKPHCHFCGVYPPLHIAECPWKRTRDFVNKLVKAANRK